MDPLTRAGSSSTDGAAGLPLYHAAAAFVRHTLGAFNSELHVALCRLHVAAAGRRRREIGVRTLVCGRSRLSGLQNEWDVYVWRGTCDGGMLTRGQTVDVHGVAAVGARRAARRRVDPPRAARVVLRRAAGRTGEDGGDGGWAPSGGRAAKQGVR